MDFTREINVTSRVSLSEVSCNPNLLQSRTQKQVCLQEGGGQYLLPNCKQLSGHSCTTLPSTYLVTAQKYYCYGIGK